MAVAQHPSAETPFYKPAPVWRPPHPNLFPRSSQIQVIVNAAWRRGCSVEMLGNQQYMVRHGDTAVGFSNRMSERTSVFGRGASNQKEVAKQFLEAAGLRVPAGRIFKASAKRSAWAFAETMKSAVTKPVSGSGGKGVTIGITTREDFDQGWSAASEVSNSVIVEPMISGADYRLFVIQDRLVAAARRLPASVTGDGVNSIADLVKIKDSERRPIPYIGVKEFKLSESMLYHLSQQGLSPESIPPSGNRIELHPIANISAGGDSEDVTDLVHPSFCEIAVRARRAIPGIFHAGIDLLAGDITKPAEEQEWGICEINTNPDTSLHHYPIFGEARDVAGALIEALFPTARLDPPCPRKSAALRITGKVQGVGFRNWLRRAAVCHAVDGWAENLQDGSVAVALSGPEKAVDALVDLCRSGPDRAKVTGLDVTPLNEQPLPGFEIKAEADTEASELAYTK